MSPKVYRLLTQLFLLVNSLFWLPWGYINLVRPESWSGELIPNMDIYDLSRAATRTEVRAMYGGLQMAIGSFAIFGAFRAKYREPALMFFVFALTGLVMCRMAGMVIEGESSYLLFAHAIPPGKYNQVGLAMYELPNMIFAWIVLLLGLRINPLPSGAH